MQLSRTNRVYLTYDDYRRIPQDGKRYELFSPATEEQDRGVLNRGITAAGAR